MSTHFTPGPWKRHDRAELTIIGAGCCVATCGGYSDNQRDPDELHGEQLANARLIAAAPDLLEALERLMVECDLVSEDAVKAYANARAVIAKATGGEA